MPRKSARTIELEEGILNSVDLLDRCDGSRNDLVSTLDQVRDYLVDSYGDEFQTDYDEMLGVESEDDESTDEQDEEDEEG
jgi:Ran GTPase-activating protein (RanGAP) involved in mRNA processing and transport